MLVCVDWRMSVRCLCFPFEKMFELNFSAMWMARCRATHAHFTHCVVRDMFGTSPRREATLRSMNLFREIFQVVDRIVTSSTRFVSGMLRVRCLVLMCNPIWVQTCEHAVLNHSSMDSGLRRSCKSGFPSSVHRTSMLQDRAGCRCA